ncbi:hypothetical protein [Dyadobacter aurulentus]|uniref:hypothetical protein n=1 Tax=Dyadobacter sp. UC 10 TaxID=2605428 RepID=UPI0011F2EFDA|nr:hypothetical protein [Dyadobacter sp. UC 10]KAA0991087.1 hypothetical protein FXO21_13410 [Dyadobacter sp. UC 10]
MTTRIFVRNFVFAFLACFVLFGCDERKTDERNEKAYYDLRGFVEDQIVYLKEKKPQVTKTAKLDGEAQTIQSAEIDWDKEFGLFLQADINKPSYAQSYDVVRKDSATFEYRLKQNADLPVRYLKIVVDTLLKSPVRVTAIIQSKNRIYESEKNIELTYSRKNNLPQISFYLVSGYQKLIFMEPKSFSITSKIGQ